MHCWLVKRFEAARSLCSVLPPWYRPWPDASNRVVIATRKALDLSEGLLAGGESRLEETIVEAGAGAHKELALGIHMIEHSTQAGLDTCAHEEEVVEGHYCSMVEVRGQKPSAPLVAVDEDNYESKENTRCAFVVTAIDLIGAVEDAHPDGNMANSVEAEYA